MSCEVCGNEQSKVVSSQFMPISYSKCDDCRARKILPYWEIKLLLEDPVDVAAMDLRYCDRNGRPYWNEYFRASFHYHAILNVFNLPL